MLQLVHPMAWTTDGRIASLVVALATALAGCAGSSMTADQANTALRAVHPNDEVVITFLDGGTVRATPNQHRWTDTVGAYQVRGTRRPRAGSRSTESYTGWIRASEVDSMRTIGSVSTPVHVLYLKDGSHLYASPSDVVELPPRADPGFWCTGEYLRPKGDGIFGSDSTFAGTIDPADVRSVEVVDQELRATSYVLQGIGMVVAIPVLVTIGGFLVWAWVR